MAQITAGMETLAISKSKELKGTEKRDSLIAIEKKYQEKWAEDKIFESNAPSTAQVPPQTMSAAELRQKYPKYFGCFAYPYMNGTLHAGHSFTVSKVEFIASSERMHGKNVLFPLGFHCTGMPIKACADKLVNEVKMFGSEFSGYKEDMNEEQPAAVPIAPATTKEDPTKFTAKKGKAAAKTIKMKYQFQIMEAQGIPRQEIHRFADPQHWLSFFPPLCRRDLSGFGAKIDWRRSFVTTDTNPYYDSFVRWQMNRLRELEKIKFGKRYTIYSIKDGQPCMDHDRSQGEAVNPQEYTAIKLKVLEWSPQASETLLGKMPKNVDVFLVAATLRPETMYGQTCCFIGPKITYGVFEATAGQYYVVTERAARNMAYQGIFSKEGEIKKIAEIAGVGLVGTLVHAPLSFHTKGVRVLPMESVLPTKGTGVVSCVPSDSPDDHANITELAKKADYYKITKEWAELEIFPVIKTPTYGDLCAPALVKKLKINSPKDAKQLAEAKELAYKEGFYQGVMVAGDFRGEKVEAAKPKVRQQIIDLGQAFAYSEPEAMVVSRSGDECIVSLMDQWYLDYGEPSWRDAALEWVENKDDKGLKTYSSEVQHQFKGVLNWLNQWACARSFGLGSKLPWDKQFLVESLSDSTIYMAYYTVAHLLHKDIFGREKGTLNIGPEQMTDEMWDYVFCRSELDDELLSKGKVSKDAAQAMRREFEYWYPLDLRSSGKDLIPNHLTFFIYVHLALFPKEYWPRSIRANGHLTLNGEKMSKSTGNFLTLHEMLQKYGADATRVALADAGDGVADANFEEDVADNTILRLYNLREWIEEVIQAKDELRTGPLNEFQDALFDNEMNGTANEAVKHFSDTNFKLALKCGFYDFTSARDFYREACASGGLKMHRDLVLKYIENQALLLAVCAPHWAEYVWLEQLGKPESIHKARFPTLPAANPQLTAQREYVRMISANINSAEAAQLKKKAKGKEVMFDPKKPKKVTIFCTDKFPEWQEKYIDLVRELWQPQTMTIDDKELMAKVGKMGDMKKAMPFVQGLKKRLQAGEDAKTVLNRKIAFNEEGTLVSMMPGLKRTANLELVEVINVQAGGKSGKKVPDGGNVDISGIQAAENAVPGVPTYLFANV